VSDHGLLAGFCSAAAIPAVSQTCTRSRTNLFVNRRWPYAQILMGRTRLLLAICAVLLFLLAAALTIARRPDAAAALRAAEAA
jgi:hypothetical protein